MLMLSPCFHAMLMLLMMPRHASRLISLRRCCLLFLLSPYTAVTNITLFVTLFLRCFRHAIDRCYDAAAAVITAAFLFDEMPLATLMLLFRVRADLLRC